MEEKEKVHLVKASAGSTSSMIFHLKQHKKEFKSFEEETEMQENENKKKNLAKKIATLELGIGSKSLGHSAKISRISYVINRVPIMATQGT